jgi:t-SNARE complex subunit (syntaxin)
MTKDKPQKPMTLQERRAAERRAERKNQIILGAVLLVCVIAVVVVILVSKPQKALNCDGGGASLLQFGSCR